MYGKTKVEVFHYTKLIVSHARCWDIMNSSEFSEVSRMSQKHLSVVYAIDQYDRLPQLGHVTTQNDTVWIFRIV